MRSLFVIIALLPLAAWASHSALDASDAPNAASATATTLAAPTVGANVRVTSNAGQGPANENMVAVDPTNARHLIATAKDYTLTATTTPRCHVNRVWGGVYVSFDGGASWTDAQYPLSGLASGFDCMSDPVVVFGPDGTAHFTGLMEAKVLPVVGGFEPCPITTPALALSCVTQWGLLYAQSKDGLSWTNEQMIWTGTGGANGYGDAWADKNWQAVDPHDANKVYVTWDLVAGVQPKPMLSRSLDGGATWITTPLPAQNLGALAAPIVDESSALHIALQGSCTRPHTPLATSCILVLTSLDGGATFLVTDAGPIRGSPNGTPYRAVASPYIAASHGHVVVAWTDGVYQPSTLRTMGRIATAHSEDGGLTFTEVVLADAATQHQVIPQIAAKPDGTIGVAYYQDDNSGSHNLRARYQQSPDGGASWSTPVSLSSVSYTPWSSFHQDGYTFIGDYLGLAAGSDNAFHATWLDTRNGRADIYTATVG